MSPARVSATTRVLAVLGDPVSHSLSPLIQNAAIRASGVDGVYVALRCDPQRLEGLIRGLSGTGGGGNITLPHKQRAAALVDEPSEAVRRTGACNTFWGADGCIYGDNTDVEGFRRALARFLGGPPAEQRVLLLGSGGAARAVLVALLDDGAREVRVLNRSVERARQMSARIGSERVRVAQSRTDVDKGRFDLVVNATSVGLNGDDGVPIDLSRLEQVGAVMDLVYGAAPTALVRAAAANGIPASDGGEMLVQQGAVAFERWWGREAPVDVMREALAGARAP
jgi:shikimate dehydrogenase